MSASGFITLFWVFFINPLIDVCFYSSNFLPDEALAKTGWQQLCVLVSTSASELSALGSWNVIGLLAYTIIVGNFLGYTLYATVLKRYSATLVSLAGFSYPIFAAIIAYFALGETVTWQFVAAAGVIFIGLVVFNLDRLRPSIQRPLGATQDERGGKKRPIQSGGGL